jgi:hypothetical protein
MGLRGLLSSPKVLSVELDLELDSLLGEEWTGSLSGPPLSSGRPSTPYGIARKEIHALLSLYEPGTYAVLVNGRESVGVFSGHWYGMRAQWVVHTIHTDLLPEGDFLVAR